MYCSVSILGESNHMFDRSEPNTARGEEHETINPINNITHDRQPLLNNTESNLPNSKPMATSSRPPSGRPKSGRPRPKSAKTPQAHRKKVKHLPTKERENTFDGLVNPASSTQKINDQDSSNQTFHKHTFVKTNDARPKSKTRPISARVRPISAKTRPDSEVSRKSIPSRKDSLLSRHGGLSAEYEMLYGKAENDELDDLLMATKNKPPEHNNNDDNDDGGDNDGDNDDDGDDYDYDGDVFESAEASRLSSLLSNESYTIETKHTRITSSQNTNKGSALPPVQTPSNNTKEDTFIKHRSVSDLNKSPIIPPIGSSQKTTLPHQPTTPESLITADKVNASRTEITTDNTAIAAAVETTSLDNFYDDDIKDETSRSSVSSSRTPSSLADDFLDESDDELKKVMSYYTKTIYDPVGSLPDFEKERLFPKPRVHHKKAKIRNETENKTNLQETPQQSIQSLQEPKSKVKIEQKPVKKHSWPSIKRVLSNKARILRNKISDYTDDDDSSPEPSTNAELGQNIDFMSFFEGTTNNTENKPGSVISDELTFIKPPIKTKSPTPPPPMKTESKEQLNQTDDNLVTNHIVESENLNKPEETQEIEINNEEEKVATPVSPLNDENISDKEEERVDTPTSKISNETKDDIHTESNTEPNEIDGNKENKDSDDPVPTEETNTVEENALIESNPEEKVPETEKDAEENQLNPFEDNDLIPPEDNLPTSNLEVEAPDGPSASVEVSGGSPELAGLVDSTNEFATPDELRASLLNGSLFSRASNEEEGEPPRKPKWHPPWQLKQEIVASSPSASIPVLVVDPTNRWFASGATDKMIKFADLEHDFAGWVRTFCTNTFPEEIEKSMHESCLSSVVNLWDTETGRHKLNIKAHKQAVRAMTFGPEGHRHLYSTGDDRQLLCHDIEVNRVISHIKGNAAVMYGLSIYEPSNLLVCGGRDKLIKLYDTRTSKLVKTLRGHQNTVSCIITNKHTGQIISGSHDGTLRTWDVREGKCMNLLQRHKKAVRMLAQHPDQNTVLSASSERIMAWDLPNGDEVQEIEANDIAINSVTINQMGVLVAGGSNGTIHLWDYKSGHLFQKISRSRVYNSQEVPICVFSTKFDHSGTKLICSDACNVVKIYGEAYSKPAIRIVDFKQRRDTRASIMIQSNR